MKDSEITDVNGRYTERLKRLGPTPEALGWDKRRHNVRFQVFLEGFQFEGCSVLDFGCGFGDLFEFLNKKRGLTTAYTGVDINADLLDVAKSRHPEEEFICQNLIQEPFGRTFDYVVSSGVHNIRIEDNDTFLRDSIHTLYAHCEKGLALNFLSNRVDYPTQESHHTDPVDVLKLAYEYSNRIVLRNDYMPFEFTLFIYKQDSFDPRVAVYPEYVDYVEHQNVD